MPARRLPKKELEKSIGTAPEGRTQELDAIPVALLEYALGVAERAEAFDSMVRAHTACTDAAERQIVLGDVHDRSVNGDIAGRGTAQHLAPLVTVATKVVERQWPRSRIHIGDGVIRVAIRKDRQDRTEDLLMGDAHMVRDAQHDRRRSVWGRPEASPGLFPTSMICAPCARASSIRPFRRA